MNTVSLLARSATIALIVLAGCGGGAAEPPPASPTSPSLPPSMAGGGAAQSGSNEKTSPEVERAIASIKAGDYRSAKAALDQALQKNPKDGTAAYYMGVALENLGDKPGAEQKYKDAMANKPDLAEAAIN